MELSDIFRITRRVTVVLFEQGEYLNSLGEVMSTAGSTAVVEMPSPGFDPGLLKEGKPASLIFTAGDKSFRVEAEVKKVLQKDRFEFNVMGEVVEVQRRDYFRVTDYLPMEYHVIKEKDYPKIREYLMRRPKVILDVEAGEQIMEISERIKDDVLASYLVERINSIEKKIDTIINILKKEKKGFEKPRRKEYWVNISGSGIKFLEERPLEPKNLLQLYLELPLKPPVEVSMIAEVLRVEERYHRIWGKRWGIACVFKDIKESERDDIIRYTFQKQREMLKRW